MQTFHLKYIFFVLLIQAFAMGTIFAQNDVKLREIQTQYPQLKEGNFLWVNLQAQKMYRLRNNEIITTYVISGAKAGAGCKAGSNQTPTGLHTVAEKYGDDVPTGGILKSRKYTGEVATIYTDETDVATDYVTTRILWLKGLEEGINKGGKVDSYNRYIYIHGTPEEGLLGKPASHGCIRMQNREVIELYNQTNVGELVLITN